MTQTPTATNETAVRRRAATAGAGWGAVATLAMTAVMLAGTATGASPLPKPVPAALVGHTIGPLARPALMTLALLGHLAYGAAAGALFAATVRRHTLARGVLLGAGLWLVMGLVWLPYLGWGLFGLAKGGGVAAMTLLLHLTYGTTLGWLLARRPAGV